MTLSLLVDYVARGLIQDLAITLDDLQGKEDETQRRTSEALKRLSPAVLGEIIATAPTHGATGSGVDVLRQQAAFALQRRMGELLQEQEGRPYVPRLVRDDLAS